MTGRSPKTTPHMAYPGCYALSKVLEEVMLEQFGIQYDLNGCCLRAPWIMEKDDFRYTLSFGDDLFGGPDWKTMVPAGDAKRYAGQGHRPAAAGRRRPAAEAQFRACRRSRLGDPGGDRQSAHRSASSSTSAWTAPSTTARWRHYLARTRGLDSIEIPSRFHSNWMDNSKAKYLLGWQPEYDLEKLIDSAWEYERARDDPRVVWYPG